MKLLTMGEARTQFIKAFFVTRAIQAVNIGSGHPPGERHFLKELSGNGLQIEVKAINVRKMNIFPLT